MKNGTKLFIYTFIVLGFVLALTNGCKKEDIKIDPVITWANPADIIYGTLLSATQLNATADVSGTFIYTPPAGTKLSVGANQDLKVDFTPTDANKYNTASKTVKINVTPFNKKDPVITWANPADINYGMLLSATQLNATADVPGTFVYTPPVGTKLNEGSNQNLKVDFTPTDTTNYNLASKIVIINVTAPITVTDIDGNLYHTVTIGTQTWMVENLKTTKYRNGDHIPNITDATEWSTLSTGAYCDYDNKPDNSATYGKLYNWYAVDDSRKIAPAGWHVPSDKEWTTLESYVTANPGTSGSVAKALTSTTNWASSTEEFAIGNDLTKNNSTGFTALPGGYRYYGNGTYGNVGSLGRWWSSSEYETDLAWIKGTDYDRSYFARNYYNKQWGFSVRCLKDY
jgi:uncharacterized protein (TIGR02145 family)